MASCGMAMYTCNATCMHVSLTSCTFRCVFNEINRLRTTRSAARSTVRSDVRDEAIRKRHSSAYGRKW